MTLPIAPPRRFAPVRALLIAVLLMVRLLDVGTAHAESERIEQIEIVGASRTRESTLLELLPRPAPAAYTDAELDELERRIDNLGIFDHVLVERRGVRLRIEVREKWTLVPSVDFASGKTLADSSGLLGLTEFNTLGAADQTAVVAYREQRGWGISGGFSEHPYRRHRWTLGVDGWFDTTESRFEDNSGWRMTQGGGTLGFTSPPSMSQWFNQRLGVTYTREMITDVRGPVRPPDGHNVQTFVGFSWDRYRWHDLVSQGVRAEIVLGAGMLAGPAVSQPRHSAEATAIGALAIGRTTVLMARVSGSLFTRGNPQFSGLLGSIKGVRGLEDTFYRNWAQSYANVELRQSVRIARRWALQGVVFADGALFERLDAEGGRGEALAALSAGIGGRLVPTWLASIVGRVDGARLLYPEPRWFVQVGLSQYF